jgi:hypothetical protein
MSADNGPQTPRREFSESTDPGDPRKNTAMHAAGHARAPRPKFDTLFADPRHYRGDCRLLRTAIRRGWLNDAPQADRDVLVARLEQASAERRTGESGAMSARALVAECYAVMELNRANTAPLRRALRYAWAGELTDRITGRPRDRWHVSDYSDRIDANELRRRAKADCTDLGSLHSVFVRSAYQSDDAGERIALAVVADARYGWRVWLVCPRCRCRRVHLYAVRSGAKCRGCARVTYSRRRRADPSA